MLNMGSLGKIKPTTRILRYEFLWSFFYFASILYIASPFPSFGSTECKTILDDFSQHNIVSVVPKSLRIHHAKVVHTVEGGKEVAIGWNLELGIFPNSQKLVPQRVENISCQSNPGLASLTAGLMGFSDENDTDWCRLSDSVQEVRVLGAPIPAGHIPPSDMRTRLGDPLDWEPTFGFRYKFIPGSSKNLEEMKKIAGPGLDRGYIVLRIGMVLGYEIKELWQIEYSPPESGQWPELSYIGQFSSVGHKIFVDLPSEQKYELSDLLSSVRERQVDATSLFTEDPEQAAKDDDGVVISADDVDKMFDSPSELPFESTSEKISITQLDLSFTFEQPEDFPLTPKKHFLELLENTLAWQGQNIGLSFRHGYGGTVLDLKDHQWTDGSDGSITLTAKLTGPTFFLKELEATFLKTLTSSGIRLHLPDAHLHPERGFFVGNPVVIKGQISGRSVLPLELPVAQPSGLDHFGAAQVLFERFQASDIHLESPEIRRLRPEEMGGTSPIRISQEIWLAGREIIANEQFIVVRVHSLSIVDQLNLPHSIEGFPIAYVMDKTTPKVPVYSHFPLPPGMLNGEGILMEAVELKRSLLANIPQFTEESVDVYATTIDALSILQSRENFVVEGSAPNTDTEVLVVVLSSHAVAQVGEVLRKNGSQDRPEKVLKEKTFPNLSIRERPILLGIRGSEIAK